MDKKKLLNEKGGFLGWFKSSWSQNAMFSTVFALVIMVLIQCVVQTINIGSVGGMFGAMGRHSDLKVPPCQPTDVANIILFLASDESRAITGQALVTDFGSTL